MRAVDGMGLNYLGELPSHDLLHNYLQDHILPHLNCDARQACFRVYRMHSASNEVYLYEEKSSRAKVIGKFYSSVEGKGAALAARKVAQEFTNLNMLRSRGLHSDPHHVVRPYAYNLALNNVLIEEYCEGQPFSDVISNAVHFRRGARLYKKLTSLAYFLATMHNTNTTQERVNFNTDCSYFDRLVGQLQRRHLVHDAEVGHLSHLRDRWRSQSKMWEDNQVLVHGDATPANFLFGRGLRVTAIDLERMQHTDRTFDLGRVVGELQHHFLLGTGNRYHAEPYIGHFLWEYCSHFPNQHSAFRSITARLPFQMSVTFLRIARNHWISREHAHKLIAGAKAMLESV